MKVATVEIGDQRYWGRVEGESLVQAAGLTVENFVSAATGIAADPSHVSPSGSEASASEKGRSIGTAKTLSISGRLAGPSCGEAPGGRLHHSLRP